MKKAGIICLIVTGITAIAAAITYFITKRELKDIFFSLDDDWDCDGCDSCLREREE